MTNKTVTVVVRRIDGSFSEKFSVAVDPEMPSDIDTVKNFVSDFMINGKSKWFELYEGTNLYFGDFRVKPFYTSRVEE